MFGFRRTLAQTGARACLSGAALVAMLALGGINASSAMASPECSPLETNVMGQGSSAQRVAQEQWTGREVRTKVPGTEELPTEAIGGGYAEACPQGKGDDTVSYVATGTVAGLEAFAFLGEGKVDHETTYIGTDYAPTAAQIEHAEKVAGGAKPIIFPVAQTAIAVVAHLPSGCAIKGGITWKDLNKLFAGTLAKWSELETDNGNVACNAAIVRVLPSEASGEAYNFKNYLSTLETGQGAEAPGCNAQTGHSKWAELRAITSSGSPNTVWPECLGRSAVHRSAAGGALAEYVKSTVDTIGFAALPDARAKSAATVPLQNGQVLGSPTYGTPEEGETGESTTKANCANRSYSIPEGALDTPTSTGEGVDWSGVFGAAPTVGGERYPLCTLTYDIAWGNYELAGYGAGSGRKLTPVLHGYFAYLLGEGQSLVNGSYYSELPHASKEEEAAASAQAAAQYAITMVIPGFASAAYPAAIEGVATSPHTFTNKGANVTCTEVNASETLFSEVITLRLSHLYAGCQSGTRAVDAEVPGELRFRTDEWSTGAGIKFKVTEPVGVTICTIEIVPQWLFNGAISYENTVGGEIKVTTTSTGVEYTTVGAGCGQQGTFTDGAYSGVENLKGSNGALTY
jgi:ABC-type phosphate transport system substrate-binding protein